MPQQNLATFALLLAIASAHPAWPCVEHGERKLHWYYSGIGSPSVSAAPYQSGNTTAHVTSSSLYTMSLSPVTGTSSSVAVAIGSGWCSQTTKTVTTYATVTVTENPSATYEQRSSSLSGPASTSGPSTPAKKSSVSHAPSLTDTTASESSSQTLSTKETKSSLSSSRHPKPQGGSKRGIIATPDAVIPLLAKYPKITWSMNWWEGPTTGTPNHWMFLPELTHLDPDQYWQSTIAGLNHNQSPYLAGFLEPDDNNYAVDEAVQSWKANLEPLSQKFTLVPPIVGQNGLDWLQQFMHACTGCTLNGPIAYTVYVSADAAGVTDFKNHLHSMMAAFPGRELWVANFGPLGNDGSPEWLMRQLIPYLDSVDIVTHYAWAGDQTFLDGSDLTPLAELYCTM